jgi:hypothetical protein
MKVVKTEIQVREKVDAIVLDYDEKQILARVLKMAYIAMNDTKYMPPFHNHTDGSEHNILCKKLFELVNTNVNLRLED